MWISKRIAFCTYFFTRSVKFQPIWKIVRSGKKSTTPERPSIWRLSSLRIGTISFIGWPSILVSLTSTSATSSNPSRTTTSKTSGKTCSAGSFPVDPTILLCVGKFSASSVQRKRRGRKRRSRATPCWNPRRRKRPHRRADLVPKWRDFVEFSSIFLLLDVVFTDFWYSFYRIFI